MNERASPGRRANRSGRRALRRLAGSASQVVMARGADQSVEPPVNLRMLGLTLETDRSRGMKLRH
jgi:hypothetical protein